MLNPTKPSYASDLQVILPRDQEALQSSDEGRGKPQQALTLIT